MHEVRNGVLLYLPEFDGASHALSTWEQQRVTASSKAVRARSRASWAICAGLAAATLATAGAITPNPAGFGTHTQLGLPPCGLLYFTGLPCPLCGLTTAFAYMARMQVTSALHAHALGPVLFLLVALALPCSLLACARGVPVLHVIELLRVARVAAMIGLAVALCWITRIAALLFA